MVVYDQEILWFQGYGKRNYFDSNSGPPTIDDYVALASITKTFTGMMMFQLRDKGIISLDQAGNRMRT